MAPPRKPYNPNTKYGRKKRRELSRENKVSPEQPNDRRRRIFVFIGKILGALALIFGLGGFGGYQLYEWITYDKKEAYYKETRVRGIFLNPQIARDRSKNLYIFSGSNSKSIPISALREGVEFQPDDIMIDSINPVFDLSLKLIDDRLYVKSSFKDIQKDELVGDIEYQRWSLMIDNITDWVETDSTFEVFDKGKNIVFGIAYRQPNIILIKGYFVFPHRVCVFSDALYPYSKERDKEKALQKISTIKQGVWYGDNINTDSLEKKSESMINTYLEFERRRKLDSLKRPEQK